MPSLSVKTDKARIRQSFATASGTYDDAAALQRTVGKALLTGMVGQTLSSTLLDLGCGTGFLTAELLAVKAPGQLQAVVAVDIAQGMLETTRTKLAGYGNVSYICADAEFLPFVADAVDGVVSNLALQWCRNLTGVFSDLRRVIKPRGQLLFSTFGPQTLQELKAAWGQVDDYVHVNDFYDATQIAHFLQQAGFQDIQIECKVYVSKYDSVLTLMRELKAIGAQNVIGERSQTITTRAQLQRMLAAYEKHRMQDGLIPATFECVFVKAKA